MSNAIDDIQALHDAAEKKEKLDTVDNAPARPSDDDQVAAYWRGKKEAYARVLRILICEKGGKG